MKRKLQDGDTVVIDVCYKYRQELRCTCWSLSNNGTRIKSSWCGSLGVIVHRRSRNYWRLRMTTGPRAGNVVVFKVRHTFLYDALSEKWKAYGTTE